MPRKIEVTVYKFDELSERAKDKARDWYRQGALDYEWWDATYEDAKNIDLKIESFDLDRHLGAEGHFTDSAVNVAEAILKSHGNETETYKDARDFLKEWEAKGKAFLDANEDANEDDFADSEEAEELEKEFLKTLLQDYAQILQNEYEYLMSDEQVDESIMANDYEFDEDGDRI